MILFISLGMSISTNLDKELQAHIGRDVDPDPLPFCLTGFPNTATGPVTHTFTKCFTDHVRRFFHQERLFCVVDIAPADRLPLKLGDQLRSVVESDRQLRE